MICFVLCFLFELCSFLSFPLKVIVSLRWYVLLRIVSLSKLYGNLSEEDR